MTETLKTLTFMVVAAAVVLVAVVTRPSLKAVAPEDFRNKPLYPEFTDPLAVTSLDILEYDEELSATRQFQVAQIDVAGKARWVIPSHENYPADAKDQVASAASGLMGLKIIELRSENQGDQQEYGVIDPDSKSVKFGATGVGERVVMKDKNNKELLALVIGKEVADRPGMRYVRRVGEDAIYVVEAKTDKLFTKFENWIERNLLKISTMDMSRVWISDYSVDVANGKIDPRGETIIEYNDAGEPKWKLTEDRKHNGEDWVPVKLAENMELNAAKLDELKTALDDLKIVDISRKPDGLSANLKAAADFTKQQESIISLAKKGFYVAKMNDQVELFSNDGEVRVGMKDGVEYDLRFGNVTSRSTPKKDDKKKDKEKDAEKKDESPGLNRYLFVMAEFNPNLIPKPRMIPYPASKKEAEKKPTEEKKPDDGKKAEDKAADEKKAETKPEEKAPEQTEAEKKSEAVLRERIDKENKRLQDEYEQKIADGKKHVEELNARFADWYYVISDEVYQKIHLNRETIFKKKEIKKAGDPNKVPGMEPEPTDLAPESVEAAPEPATPNAELEKLKSEGPDAAK